MFKCIRGRKSSREKILDAAAELVSDIGSGRLTLDAVAERAGLSKGGLLYNFPNKDALLQAMIQRIIDEVSLEKEALRRHAPPGPNLEARLCTAALRKMRAGKMKDVANGMLAASVGESGAPRTRSAGDSENAGRVEGDFRGSRRQPAGVAGRRGPEQS